MFCERCGADLAADAIFCEQCGERVQEVPSPQKARSMPQEGAQARNQEESRTSPVTRRPIPLGTVMVMMSGLLSIVMSILRAAEYDLRPAMFLSMGFLAFGLLPLLAGVTVLWSRRLKWGLILAAPAFFFQVWWWSQVWGMVNWWDVEGTLRFYGSQVICSGMFFVGLGRQILTCRLMDVTIR